MENWAVRNLPHTIYWGDGNHTIEARYSSNYLIIEFYESTKGQANRVSLFINIGCDSAQIVDLTGNGFGYPTNNKGIGTLLFNLAIQFMKCLFRERLNSIKIFGTTCPFLGSDLPFYDNDIKHRANFWSSFNLILEDPTNGRSPMEALLKDVCLKNRGMCMGKIDTMLSIHDFWRGYHRPRLFPNEINALCELSVEVHSIKALPSMDELNKKEEFSKKTYYFFLLGSACLTFIMILKYFHSMGSISLDIVGSTVILSVLFYFLIHRLTLSPFEKFFSVEAAREHSRSVINSKRNVLANLNLRNTGIFKRMFDVVTNIWPEERPEPLSSMTELNEFENNLNSQENVIAWCILLENFQTKYYYQVNSKRLSDEYDVNDFLFDMDSNNISIETLIKYSDLLDNEFEHHINRFLGSIRSHELFIRGSSHACPRRVVRGINSIAMIELYTNDPFPSDIGCIHMKLTLRHGILNFQPDWSAHKEIRRTDTINALSFLLDKNYYKKVFIRDDGKLIPISGNPKEFVLQLLDLANCRRISQAELDKYLKLLDAPPALNE